MKMTTDLEKKFDSVLSSIYKHCDENVDDLMSIFLGFLERRTDFFQGQTPSQSRQIILNALQEKWNDLDEIMEMRRKEREEAERRTEAVRKHQIEVEKSKEAKLISEKPDETVVLKTVGEYKKEKPKKAPKPSSDDEEESVVEKENDKATSKPAKTKSTPKVREEKPEEKQKRQEEEAIECSRFMPNSGNGCDLPNYKWTQTTEQVEITIPLRAGVPLKAKDVVVEMGKTHLKVGVRGKDPIIDGDLYGEVKPNDEEATWILVDKSIVNVILPKAKKAPYWPKLIMTDPEVSTKEMKADSVNFTDLEEDHKAVVEKMMFDSRAKEMGLPTSDDRKKMEMFQRLKKIDPSVKIDPSKIRMAGDQNSFSFGPH